MESCCPAFADNSVSPLWTIGNAAFLQATRGCFEQQPPCDWFWPFVMGNTHFYLATSGYHGLTYQTQGLHDWVLATEFSSTLATNQCGNAHFFLLSDQWLPNGHQFFVVFCFVFLAICLFVCLFVFSSFTLARWWGKRAYYISKFSQESCKVCSLCPCSHEAVTN